MSKEVFCFILFNERALRNTAVIDQWYPIYNSSND